jgi:simple sugar transport system permease protein
MSTVTIDAMALEQVRFWTRERRVGVGLAVAGMIGAILFGTLAGAENARFTFTERPDGPGVSIDGRTGAIVFAMLALLAGLTMLTPTTKRWFTALLALGIVGVVLSFLCWQISSAPAGLNFMPLVDIVRGTFIGALPLIFGALAGVLCERSGVVNVAIEGQLLAGAAASSAAC